MSFTVESPHQINLYWAGHVTPAKADGDIPVLVIRLRRDYAPANTCSARQAWKRCFNILRDYLGVQFCFMFQVGESAVQNWCFPRVIWLPSRHERKSYDSGMYAFNPWDPCQIQIWLSNPRQRFRRTLGRNLLKRTPATGKNGGYVRPDERVFRAPSSPYTGPHECQYLNSKRKRKLIPCSIRPEPEALKALRFRVPDNQPPEKTDPEGDVPNTNTHHFNVPISDPPASRVLEVDAFNSDLVIEEILSDCIGLAEATDSPKTVGDADHLTI
ncbi:hypothetical protein F5Y03DRAFT_393541 [Xylaria venustula]|nr:hypothetical protein F5Y03DRAFT_393541 [Xylaria venustula]